MNAAEPLVMPAAGMPRTLSAEEAFAEDPVYEGIKIAMVGDEGDCFLIPGHVSDREAVATYLAWRLDKLDARWGSGPIRVTRTRATFHTHHEDCEWAARMAEGDAGSCPNRDPDCGCEGDPDECEALSLNVLVDGCGCEAFGWWYEESQHPNAEPITEVRP